MRQIFAVFLKDLQSEFKIRYSLSALVLFIFTAIAIVVVTIAKIQINTEIFSGLVWIVSFFSTITGLSRTFISEEERSTSLFLKLNCKPYSVYLGKLLYNICISIITNLIIMLVMSILFDYIKPNNYLYLYSTLILSAVGTASSGTIISAIVAKSYTKNAVFPVISFPVLLPLVICANDATILSITGQNINQLFSDFTILISYSIALVSISYMIFDLVWID